MAEEIVIASEHAHLVAKAESFGLDKSVLLQLLLAFGAKFLELLFAAKEVQKEMPAEGILDDSKAYVKAMLLALLATNKGDILAWFNSQAADLSEMTLDKVIEFLKS